MTIPAHSPKKERERGATRAQSKIADTLEQAERSRSRKASGLDHMDDSAQIRRLFRGF
jgi:hypothetical protein